jgi:hypothetical protein
VLTRGGHTQLDAAIGSLGRQLGWSDAGGHWRCPNCAQAFPVRYRRATLLSLAAGEGYLLQIHDRVRARGFEREGLLPLRRELVELEELGLASSRPALVDVAKRAENPRRVWSVTTAGMREAERLRVP